MLTIKTTELTELQIGESPRPANIITSTLNEADNILPLLLKYQQAGRAVNLLYGFPIYPSAAPRLASLAKSLGPTNLSLMLDHPGQLDTVRTIHHESGVPVSLYIKIEMGGKRCGVIPGSQVFSELFSGVLALEEAGVCSLAGLYSHAGHSYGGNDRATAIDLLRQELKALLAAAVAIRSAAPSRTQQLMLTVGATPTTTSIRNLLLPESLQTESEAAAIAALKAIVENIKTASCAIELHAGVYPVLDIQQLATHALPDSHLTWDDMALTILTEVASLYSDREKPEALIAAGSIALGREPCKAYPGYGVVSPWNITGAKVPTVAPEEHAGWQVGKVSQEHGILRWMGERGEETRLAIGQRIQVWPNHACIAGVGFDWYLVVDSTSEGREDEVVDVWVRWRGW